MTEVNYTEHCEVCGEPTAADYINGDIVIHGTLRCKCDLEKEEQARKEREEVGEEYSYGVRKYDCFGKAKFDHCTFDKCDDSQAARACKKFAIEFGKRGDLGLVLAGPVGTGKTFLAACIANKLLVAGYTVKFSTFGEIERELWDAPSRQKVMDRLTAVDLLVVDDLGAERDTEYMTEIVTEVINARYTARKPLLVTTNITDFSSRGKVEEDRLIGRIIEKCKVILVDGNDRRIEGAYRLQAEGE